MSNPALFHEIVFNLSKERKTSALKKENITFPVLEDTYTNKTLFRPNENNTQVGKTKTPNGGLPTKNFKFSGFNDEIIFVISQSTYMI